MDNIGYYDPVMIGNRWVATPYIINFGFNPDELGYEDDYMVYESRTKETINYFGDEKTNVIKKVKFYASPKNYGASFSLGKIKKLTYGSSDSYNTLCFSFSAEKAEMRLSTLWRNFNKSDYDIKSSDFKLIKIFTFDDESYFNIINKPVVILTDAIMTKYTMKIFDDFDNVFFRFGKSFGLDVSYSDFIRIDGGKDEDTNKFEYFSVINKTQKISDEAGLFFMGKSNMLK